MINNWLKNNYPEQYEDWVKTDLFGNIPCIGWIKEVEPELYEQYLRETRPAKILQALLEGHKVKIKDMTYQIDTEYKLCVLGIRSSLVKETRIETTLNEFIKLTMSATEDEVFTIGANRVLTKL